ncbi:MAG: DUF4124 domain-containing protein, partial [Gammaproteobacteria bacterium]|nr:DUF4124 domain-containing protein [Gammaproteobacteria bacterium]
MATYRIRLIAAGRLLISLTAIAALGGASAGQLYKYRDESGAVVYSDTPPADGQAFEQQQREVARSNKPPRVAVRIEESDGLLDIWADNECHCPAEVALQLTGGSY